MLDVHCMTPFLFCPTISVHFNKTIWNIRWHSRATCLERTAALSEISDPRWLAQSHLAVLMSSGTASRVLPHNRSDESCREWLLTVSPSRRATFARTDTNHLLWVVRPCAHTGSREIALTSIVTSDTWN